jgi:hypothetical protein
MQCGRLITEDSNPLVTESGDAFLVTECFTGLRPGRVYKKEYPYWAPHDFRPKYDFGDAEELLILAATELD